MLCMFYKPSTNQCTLSHLGFISSEKSQSYGIVNHHGSVPCGSTSDNLNYKQSTVWMRLPHTQSPRKCGKQRSRSITGRLKREAPPGTENPSQGITFAEALSKCNWKCLGTRLSKPSFILKIQGSKQRPSCSIVGVRFNSGFFFFSSKAFSWIIFSILFRASNNQNCSKKEFTEMLFKLSCLNSNLALSRGYLNPALNNPAQDFNLENRGNEKDKDKI